MTSGVPEIDLTDPDVVRDPFTAYGRAREQAPLARVSAPGFSVWVLTRYDEARAVLGDPRFEITSGSFTPPPGVPEDCRPYLRTMTEMDAPSHLRLRRLVAPAFTARRAAEFRPRIEPLVEALLDELPDHLDGGAVDLLPHFARPLPIDVICELVGIPEADRPRWREYGAAVAAGTGEGFGAAIPGIVAGARDALALRRAEPADDLLTDLLTAQAEDGDKLSDTEMITMVWNVVLAGQTPINLIANAVHVLLTHPEQRARLREEPVLMPRAVEEFLRWCGPQLLSIPRYAREDVELCGTLIHKGEAVSVSIAGANRDPRVFTDPETLDLGRPAGTAPHLGFAHGPHFCLGAALARVQTEVALTALLRRYPDLAPAAAPHEARRAPDPGTWRLLTLPVTL